MRLPNAKFTAAKRFLKSRKSSEIERWKRLHWQHQQKRSKNRKDSNGNDAGNARTAADAQEATDDVADDEDDDRCIGTQQHRVDDDDERDRYVKVRVATKVEDKRPPLSSSFTTAPVAVSSTL